MKTAQHRGRALVGAVLVTILATACSGADRPPAAATTESGESPDVSEPAPSVLFQQDAGSRQEVAMVRVDGTGRTAPLHDLGTGHQTNPDWSPDGRRFVFAMSDGERDDLWIADADGSSARMLLDCQRFCLWLDDPDWSPDGTRIVYSRVAQHQRGVGVGTLESVDVATGRTRVELGPWRRSFTAGARYSPDGRQVVFEKVHTAGRDAESDVDGVVLSVVRLDRPAHPVRALTVGDLFAATADWSPDGTRIVYSALARPDASAEELFWIRPAGGVPTQLTHVTDDGGYAREPAWMPDGSGVLFSGRLTTGVGSPELLRVQLDGTGPAPAFGDAILYGRHPRVRPVV